MSSVLINGFSSKTGGGKVILDNFFENLPSKTNTNFYVVVPQNFQYKTSQCTLIRPPRILYSTFFSIFYYLIFIPYILHKYKVKHVLNLGDLVIPFHRNQTYFFDWAYLVLKDNSIWKKMSIKDWLLRKFKILLIKSFSFNNTKVIFQTNIMAKDYSNQMKFKGLSLVVPTPIKHSKLRENKKTLFKNNFIYLSNEGPHKNHEIIPKVAQKISETTSSFKITLTLPKTSNTWIRIEKEAKRLGVQKLIETTGYIENDNVIEELQKYEALFFPSKLESYGLPFYEAMYARIPILASNTDNIREVCGDTALYFDPNNAESIANILLKFIHNDVNYERIMENGSMRISNQLTWKEYVQEIINFTVDK